MNDDKTYNTAYTGCDAIPVFIAFCIEQYAHEKGISGQQAMQIFDKAGILEYLKEHYEILHTQGSHWLLKEIDEIIRSKAAGK